MIRRFLYILLLFPMLAFGVDEIRIATAQANGTGTTFELSGAGHLIESHLRTLIVAGTFNGATVTYQISPDDSTWVDVSGADAITAATSIAINHRARYHRVVVAGGAGSESIDVWVL